MRGFAQHFYTLINFSDLRELVKFPCATIGVGDCEANQSSWHEAFVLQECPLRSATLDALLCSQYPSSRSPSPWPVDQGWANRQLLTTQPCEISFNSIALPDSVYKQLRMPL